MSRLFRAFLLMFVLLVESLGSAFALPPVIQAEATEQMQAQAEEVAAMPCHDEAGKKMAMPCCDDDDCRCSAGCFGATTALAPRLAEFGDLLPESPSAFALPSAPRAAHRLRLLRPPAVLES